MCVVSSHLWLLCTQRAPAVPFPVPPTFGPTAPSTEPGYVGITNFCKGPSGILGFQDHTETVPVNITQLGFLECGSNQRSYRNEISVSVKIEGWTFTFN